MVVGLFMRSIKHHATDQTWRLSDMAVRWSALVLRVAAGLVLATTVGAVGLGASAAVIIVATYVVLWQVTRQRMELRTEPTLHPAWRLPPADGS